MRLVHELLMQQLRRLEREGVEWAGSRMLKDPMWKRHPGTELGELVRQGYVERRPIRPVQQRGPFAGTTTGGAVAQAYEYRLTDRGREWAKQRDQRPPSPQL